MEWTDCKQFPIQLKKTCGRLIDSRQAAIAFVVLALHSPSPLRHAFYETFLHIHIVMVAVGFGLLWIHLNGLVAQTYLLVAVIFWGLEVCDLFFILIKKWALKVKLTPVVAIRTICHPLVSQLR